MSKFSVKKLPSFFDWVESQNVDLEPWQWEMVRLLEDNRNRKQQLKIGFYVSRNGKTILHKLWWEYHNMCVELEDACL